MAILNRLHDVFNIDPTVSVEWLLDAGQLEAVNAFFAPKSQNTLMITFAEQNFAIQVSSKMIDFCDGFKLERLFYLSLFT